MELITRWLENEADRRIGDEVEPVTLNAADLSQEMEAMREWLDRYGYETRRFDCNQYGNTVVVSVEFMVEPEAEAFAARFGAVPCPSVSCRAEAPELEGIQAASSVKLPA